MSSEQELLLDEPASEQIDDGSSERKISPTPLLPALFLHILAYTQVINLTQQWLLLYICQKSEASDSISWEECRKIPNVQASTAKWEMTLSLLANVPSLLSVPLLGKISDRIGRKPVMLLPVVSTILSNAVILMVMQFKLPLWILALERLIGGFLGSWGMMISVAFAYIADISSLDVRTSIFVILEASFFLGFTIGPLLGGTIYRKLENGIERVFQFSLGIQIFVFLYILLFVKESLKKKGESTNENVSAFDFLKSIVYFFAESYSTNRYILFFVMYAIGVTIGGASTFFLWAAYSFGWDSFDQGVYLLIFALGRLFTMLLIFPIVKRVFVPSILLDIWIMRISLLVMAIGAFLMSVSTFGWMLLVIVSFEGLSALGTPTTKGLLSKSVSHESQGLMFSCIQVIQQLGLLTATIIFPNLWAYTVNTSYNRSFLYVELFVYSIAFFVTLGLEPNSFVSHLEEPDED